MCAARGVEVLLELDKSLQPMKLNKTEFKQVMTNLIKNAGEATETLAEKGLAPEGYQPRIRVCSQRVNGRAELTISATIRKANRPTSTAVSRTRSS